MRFTRIYLAMVQTSQRLTTVDLICGENTPSRQARPTRTPPDRRRSELVPNGGQRTGGILT